MKPELTAVLASGDALAAAARAVLATPPLCKCVPDSGCTIARARHQQQEAVQLWDQSMQMLKEAMR